MCRGGCNTIAQALWTVANTRCAAELGEFVRKLHVDDVLGQDDAGTWIAKTLSHHPLHPSHRRGFTDGSRRMNGSTGTCNPAVRWAQSILTGFT